MNLPNFLQRLIDENHDTYFEDVTINGFYELGIHDAYKAMQDNVHPTYKLLMFENEIAPYREKIRALELKIEELENYNIELQRETDHE